MKNIIITVLMLLLPFWAMAQGQVTRKPTPNPVKPTHKHSVYGPKNCKECNRLREQERQRIEEQRRKEQERIAEQQRLEEMRRREDEQRLAEERKRKEEEDAKLAEQKRIIDNLVDNMVYVDGGRVMTTDSEEFSRKIYVILYPYYISRYEVTQAEWKAVMGSNPSNFKGDNLPVENISWKDCQEFIHKLNIITGKYFRLPKVVEWEFAAHGGNNNHRYKYSGSDNIDSVAWYKDNSDKKTHSVGLKNPNELGLYDMSGNVYEWCQDERGCTIFGKKISHKVYCGGSWACDEGLCVGTWIFEKSDTSNYSVGLRLAL